MSLRLEFDAHEFCLKLEYSDEINLGLSYVTRFYWAIESSIQSQIQHLSFKSIGKIIQVLNKGLLPRTTSLIQFFFLL